MLPDYNVTSYLVYVAQVYTLKIFKYFQKEFRGSLGTRANEPISLGNSKLYGVVAQKGDEADHEVMYTTYPCGRIEVNCTCKHFESVGWLCKHCLRVLDKNSIEKIPDQYILQRWTRSSKEKVWDRVLATNSSNKNASECIAWRQLMNSNFNELVLKSEGNMEARRILEAGYQRDLLAVRNIINNMEMPRQETTADQSNTTSSAVRTSTTILDPQFTKTKGRKKQRVKNIFERQKPITTEFGSQPRNKHLL